MSAVISPTDWTVESLGAPAELGEVWEEESPAGVDLVTGCEEEVDLCRKKWS